MKNEQRLEPKSTKLQLRVSTTDLLKIQKAAFDADLSVSAYVRRKLLKQTAIWRHDYARIKEVDK